MQCESNDTKYDNLSGPSCVPKHCTESRHRPLLVGSRSQQHEMIPSKIIDTCWYVCQDEFIHRTFSIMFEHHLICRWCTFALQPALDYYVVLTRPQTHTSHTHTTPRKRCCWVLWRRGQANCLHMCEIHNICSEPHFGLRGIFQKNAWPLSHLDCSVMSWHYIGQTGISTKCQHC